MLTVPEGSLRQALDSYARVFGHEVPDVVVSMFASRPGALVFEIQDALRRTQPVPGWHAQAKRNAIALRAGQ